MFRNLSSVYSPLTQTVFIARIQEVFIISTLRKSSRKNVILHILKCYDEFLALFAKNDSEKFVHFNGVWKEKNILLAKIVDFLERYDPVTRLKLR